MKRKERILGLSVHECKDSLIGEYKVTAVKIYTDNNTNLIIRSKKGLKFKLGDMIEIEVN